MKKLLISLIVILLVGCSKNVKKEEKIQIITIDNLNIEIYSNLKVGDLIINKDEVKIVNNSDIIDTSKLGEKEIVIKYYDKKENEQYYSFKIKIVDTKPPVIKCNDIITTTKGKQLDLLKKASVTDNSKEDISLSINGKYNYNKVGQYKLKYIAMDSSGNKTEKAFVLNVQEKLYKIQLGSFDYGYYSWDQPNGQAGVIVFLDKNGSLFATGPAYCGKNECTGVVGGSYKREGNNLIIKYTTWQENFWGDQKIKKINVTRKFKIVSDKKMLDEKNHPYIYSYDIGVGY